MLRICLLRVRSPGLRIIGCSLRILGRLLRSSLRDGPGLISASRLRAVTGHAHKLIVALLRGPQLFVRLAKRLFVVFVAQLLLPLLLLGHPLLGYLQSLLSRLQFLRRGLLLGGQLRGTLTGGSPIIGLALSFLHHGVCAQSRLGFGLCLLLILPIPGLLLLIGSRIGPGLLLLLVSLLLLLVGLLLLLVSLLLLLVSLLLGVGCLLLLVGLLLGVCLLLSIGLLLLVSLLLSLLSCSFCADTPLLSRRSLVSLGGGLRAGSRGLIVLSTGGLVVLALRGLLI